MATIKISRAKSCTAALNYAQGQNQLKEPDKAWLVNQGVNPELVASLHNRAVVTSGLNIDPAYASSQMKQTRDLFQNTGSTQAMRVIQSFDEHDLNAANPADWD
ncbi:relaxase/mobilization nuclease domain-containing protein, partial [Levilactobacillus brevis]